MHQVVGHQVLEQADLPYWDSSKVWVVSMNILSYLNLTKKIFLGNTEPVLIFFPITMDSPVLVLCLWDEW